MWSIISKNSSKIIYSVSYTDLKQSHILTIQNLNNDQIILQIFQFRFLVKMYYLINYKLQDLLLFMAQNNCGENI